MTVAFIPAIGHQKRTTTQKVIPIFRWGDRLILRHCLALRVAVTAIRPVLQAHRRRDA